MSASAVVGWYEVASQVAASTVWENGTIFWIRWARKSELTLVSLDLASHPFIRNVASKNRQAFTLCYLPLDESINGATVAFIAFDSAM